MLIHLYLSTYLPTYLFLFIYHPSIHPSIHPSVLVEAINSQRFEYVTLVYSSVELVIHVFPSLTFKLCEALL